MVEWFQALIDSLPVPVAMVVTASFPLIAIAATAGAVVAAWRHRRTATAALLSLALLGFAGTILFMAVASAAR
jgi:hypothetical protein